MKHLLKLSDLSDKDILDILNLADQLKYEKKNHIEHQYLKGKTLGMIFQKNSTRTRVSFEVGMYELGGHALFISSNDSQISRGEPIYDTAKVLSRYLDGIMIRTYKQSDVEDLAKYGSIPVINGLTDYEHPCQVLADLMTIKEYMGSFKGKKFCFIGDGNNMVNSYIAGCIKMGMDVAVACPKGYEPDRDLINWGNANGNLLITDDILLAAKNADVLATDVWASMGMEKEIAERKMIFKDFQINDEVMSVSNQNAIVLHCLPAHREEEISSSVFKKHEEEIYDEAENRLHVQKAILVKLMGN